MDGVEDRKIQVTDDFPLFLYESGNLVCVRISHISCLRGHTLGIPAHRRPWMIAIWAKQVKFKLDAVTGRTIAYFAFLLCIQPR